MVNILNYVYQTWRTGEFGYLGIGIGVLLGIALIIGLIVVVHNSGRNDI